MVSKLNCKLRETLNLICDVVNDIHTTEDFPFLCRKFFVCMDRQTSLQIFRCFMFANFPWIINSQYKLFYTSILIFQIMSEFVHISLFCVIICWYKKILLKRWYKFASSLFSSRGGYSFFNKLTSTYDDIFIRLREFGNMLQVHIIRTMIIKFG